MNFVFVLTFVVWATIFTTEFCKFSFDLMFSLDFSGSVCYVPRRRYLY